MNDLLSDFEDLLKIKNFSEDSHLRMAYLCTYEKIAKALKDEYYENIDEKVDRWIDITRLQYFEEVKPITYFFQAKMLYRDGFYESSIMLSRSISEMVCYELLSRFAHPFGNLDQIDLPMFRVFVDFLALPKIIEKSIFEEGIVVALTALQDKNFIKSSYKYDKNIKAYAVKNEIAKDKKNVKHLFDLFAALGFEQTDNFSQDTRKLFHAVYDIGNQYVHSKSIGRKPKDDAWEVLMMLTQILSDIFSPTTELEGKTIKSGYSDFPDICKGLNYAIEIGLTLEDAQRIYYNIPAKKSFEAVKETIGTWNGKWRDISGKLTSGTLTVRLEKADLIVADLSYTNLENAMTTDPIEIRLFEGYIHLIGFDPLTMRHSKENHISFELDFFEKNRLIGKSLSHSGRVIFER
jgi:hypothetical protein